MFGKIRAFGLLAAIGALAACSVPEDLRRETLHEGDVPVVLSSRPTPNTTPVTPALKCYGEKLERENKGGVSIGVGNIRDYTGKQGENEGYLITQGGSLMAYTALGHLVPGIALYERFDTQVADAELQYIANRQLGDGQLHQNVDAQTGQSTEVPWKPYYGGSVLQSDYYIVGGITELNFNIQSGGVELGVDQVGGRGRIYTMNVGVDLRIVGSQTLKVYDTVSIQKQISGYEVGAGVFRFFGNDLWDVNAGAKNQEPLQLAVRMAIETGLMELVESVTGVPVESCPVEVPMIERDEYKVAGKL